MATLHLQPGADLADTYRRDGAVHVPALFTTAETDEMRTVFTAQVEHDRTVGFDDRIPDDDVLARYPRLVHPHRRTDLDAGRLALRHLLDPRILDRVTALIGPALGAQSMFYFKPPTARGQALHQDNLSLRAHPETCLAVWIAVDDCDAENGALRIAPGTHRYALKCPEPADESESFVNEGLTLPPGTETVQTEMRAGDVLFFHGSTVHGSHPNRSADRFRRALIFHYVPRTSTEIARFYNPLVAPDGTSVTIAAADGGGPCGEGWTTAAN